MNTLTVFQHKQLIGNFDLIFDEAVGDCILHINDDECGLTVNAFLNLENDEMFVTLSDFEGLGKIDIDGEMSLKALKEEISAKAEKIQPISIITEAAIERFVCKAAPLIAAFQLEVCIREKGSNRKVMDDSVNCSVLMD